MASKGDKDKDGMLQEHSAISPGPASATTATLLPTPLDRTQPLSADDNWNRRSADLSVRAKVQIVDQEKFDKRYGYRRINISLGRKMYYHFGRIRKWRTAEWCDFVRARVPIVRWLPQYSPRTYLLPDVFGGFMISVMSVPQGLAYGYLAGVPPQYGLYTSIFMSFIYGIFGSSRHTGPGAFAIISMLVGSVVANIGAAQQKSDSPLDINSIVFREDYICCSRNEGNSTLKSDVAVDIAVSLTLLVGIWQLIFCALNAGLLAVWLNEYLVKGLMAGAAIQVVTSQLKEMTGIRRVPKSSEAFGLIEFYICFFYQIREIKLDVAALSVSSVFLLLFSSYVIDPIIRKYCKSFKFPMELILVVWSTALVHLLNDTRWKLPHVLTVGKMPLGLHSPRVPSMTNTMDMIPSSASIAIISFAIHIALAKMIAKDQSYQVDSNQEWLALGAMHSISSFFGCFAGGSSLGRSMMAVKFGVRTQVASFTCAIVLIGVVFGAGMLIQSLPKAVLSAIVCVALKDIIAQIWKCLGLYKQSVADYLMFYITFIGVIAINVNYGLLIGVAFALLTVVFRSQCTCVGRIPGTADFKGFGQYRRVEELRGMRVFRFDAPIYFANAEMFLHSVYAAVGVDPLVAFAEIQRQKENMNAVGATGAVPDWESGREPLIPPPLLVSDVERSEDNEPETMQLTHVIIDCSSITWLDLMGKDSMSELSLAYDKIDIRVFYAHCKVAVRQFLENTDFHSKVPKSRLFVKVSDAVEAAMQDQQTSEVSYRGKPMRYYPGERDASAKEIPLPEEPTQREHHDPPSTASSKKKAEDKKGDKKSDKKKDDKKKDDKDKKEASGPAEKTVPTKTLTLDNTMASQGDLRRGAKNDGGSATKKHHHREGIVMVPVKKPEQAVLPATKAVVRRDSKSKNHESRDKDSSFGVTATARKRGKAESGKNEHPKPPGGGEVHATTANDDTLTNTQSDRGVS